MSGPAPLDGLLRLRRRELDEARGRLACLLAAEQAASLVEAAARAALRREEGHAASLDAADAVVEAFAAWLPRGRSALAEAAADRTRAGDDLVHARAELALAHAGVEAVEALRAGHAARAAAARARAEQAEQDEIGAAAVARGPRLC